MKTNAVSRVLAVIGILTLSVTTAQGGHGQGGRGADVQGLECYLISGPTTGFVVDVGGGPSFTDRNDVTLGKSRLLCVNVTVSLVSRPDNKTGFNSLPDGIPAFQCHDIGESTNPPVIARITGGADVGTFALQGGRYICLPASIESTTP